jgi:N-acetylglutamate synthase-like GNAT family acetyltransferase
MVHFAVMELTIRDATTHDADAVARLLDNMGYPTSAQAAAAHIARFAGNPASRLQVAEESAAGVVGLVATHIVPRLDDDAFTCRITDLVVSGAHRRSGIGSTLMTAAEHEARTVGAPRLDLSSGEWRADAHAFYASHGFETRARAFTKRLSPEP